MRFFALILGKIIFVLLKLVGKNGGSLPGKVAIKYCPDLIKYFAYPSKTILVTGTNGKTSTANLITQCFQKSGFNTISNSRGDNIINGITSLLIQNSTLGFKVKSDVLVLEIDELTLAKNIKYINASDLVITNFFRDQLDRAGEMETIIVKIQDSLQDYNKNLYLNEDDPNVKRFEKFVKDARIITFGLEKLQDHNELSEVKEGKFCPVCNSEIVYDYYQYSHLGKYHCTNCNFASNTATYLGCNVDYNTNSMDVKSDDKLLYKLSYNLPATYHLYNLIATSSVALNYNLDNKAINEVFSNFNLGIGRMENIIITDKKVLLNLVKNPTGANEIIKYINNDKNEKTLIFLLNDNHADGRDISWIWDVNFEYISGLKKIILTGKRAYEIATRIKLSKLCDDIVIEKDIDKAIDTLLAQDTSYYVISTYTGLFDIRQKLLDRKK